MLPTFQTYPALTLADVQIVSQQTADDLTRMLVVLPTPFGYRRVAELYRPATGENLAAILYVHWYEPHAPDSNRQQFVAEAKALAKRGTVCLLVETLWSDLDFFIKRTQADDLENSRQEVVNLRRALDFLLAQPGVDAQRLAYVGHDFGGMYGALMGRVDQRPRHYVLMAATPRFPDWYLYYPPLEGEARAAFIAQMAPLDPIAQVAHLAPAPILFQFATDDFHVPPERANEFFAAAHMPKELRWYTAGHGLNETATQERQAWLIQQLGL